MADERSLSRAGEKPTLLLYVHALAGGGAERVVAILASAFAQAGWRVTLAVDHADDANRAFLDARVTTIVLGPGHGRAVLRLARLLRNSQPGASLSAMAASNVKHAAAALLAGRSHRAVLSYHAFPGSEPQRLSQIGYWLLPILSRLTARTVAVSKALRQELVTRWGASASRSITLYNPVVRGSDEPAQVGRDTARPLFLAAGRLIPDKNMCAVVRAFAAVAARADATLLILGEGPDRAAIEDTIAAHGLHGRVKLAGYVAEPWAEYRQAACFVSASRLESFSMVVAEALAYGLPVVSVDSPGPREVLEDGRYGALVPADNDAALAEAMLQALHKPVDPAAQRARARMFSVEAGLDAYSRLFADITAEADRVGLSRPR